MEKLIKTKHTETTKIGSILKKHSVKLRVKIAK